MKPHLKGSHPWDPPGGRHGNPLQYSCLENPRTEEPGRLQPMGLKRVGHNLSTLACTHVQQNTLYLKHKILKSHHVLIILAYLLSIHLSLYVYCVKILCSGCHCMKGKRKCQSLSHVGLCEPSPTLPSVTSY